MKKLLAAMGCLVFVMLLSVSAFSTESDQPVLSADVEQSIKDAYRLDHNEPDIPDADLVVEYHGEYGGVHVAFVDCAMSDYIDEETTQWVGPYLFFFRSSRTLYAYRGNELLSLPEAWSAGWFTMDTVQQLYNYYAQHINHIEFGQGVDWASTDWAQLDTQSLFWDGLLYIDLNNWFHTEGTVQDAIDASKADWEGYRAVVYGNVLGYKFMADPVAMLSAMAHADEITQARVATYIATSKAYGLSNVDFTEFLAELQLPADAATERAMLSKIIACAEQYYGVEIPRTGDSVALVVAALLLSGTGLAVLAIRRKKHFA